jgi:putative cell wall-binding protein
LNAPLLLVDTHSVPSAVVSELKRLKAQDAIVLGGEPSVGREVIAALDAALPGTVRRIAGKDRYETAAAVASETIGVLGSGFGHKAFVATGGGFADALAAGPVAATDGRPIYLVRPGTDGSSTIAALGSHGVTEAVILGGPSSVSPESEAALRSALGEDAVRRVAGEDRYQTAGKVAALGVAEAGMTYDCVSVATGQDFPDALTAAMLPVQQGSSKRSPLLLTPRASLSKWTEAALVDARDYIYNVYWIGTKRSVTEPVRFKIETLLWGV